MSSNITPTPAETALVNQIFAKNDPQKFGVITGELAVNIFGGAKLSSLVLGEIWGLADSENQGFLTRDGVTAAIRLIGWAQHGEKVTEALIKKPGPAAAIEGYPTPAVPRGAASPTPKSPAPLAPPPLTPADKAKFNRLFNSCGPVNGILSGEKARDVFVKSKLPVDKLSQIWGLADTQNRGSLDAADFTIAMYLIQASMSGQLSFVPTTLPPGLYEQASGADPASAFSTGGIAVHATGGSGAISPNVTGAFSSRPIAPQYTGQALQQQFTGQALSQQYTGQPLQPQTTGAGSRQAPAIPPRAAPVVPPFPLAQAAAPKWDVTPAEKTSADNFFSTLDSQNRGYIEGDIAVPFLLQSKLPEDVLAQVWDLADLNNDGRLTRDGFAVALHLIQGKLAGKDVPATLPPSLVPPSMRTNGAVSSPSQVPQPQAVPEPVRDLLWDDSPPVSATMPKPQSNVLQAQQTGSTQPSAFTTPAFTTPAFPPASFTAQPVPPARQATHDPFAPAVSNKDLLGDDEEHGATSTPIHDHSAEIGNVQIQLNSTNRSLDTTKNERQNVEESVANQASQLATLQTQLSSAKAAYETETRLLASLRERFSNQSSEIQKTREELIRAESELSATRVEKSEVEQHVLRDKEEVRDLQRKMTETGTTIQQLKAEIEKAKKDAKQQKGLLAIAKKQLASREAERLKAEKELQEANADVQEATKEREEADAELAADVPTTLFMNGTQPGPSLSADSLTLAAAQPLPVSPGSPSSLASGQIPTKSNNPFERLTMSHTGSSTRSQSPFLPFTNALLPTPTAAPPAASAETPTVDPFGFEQAFTAESPVPDTAETSTDLPTEQSSTPRPAPPGLASFSPEDVSSPSSDHDLFSTPPMTAVDAFTPGSGDRATSPASGAEVAATLFPPLDAPAAVPAAEPSHTETDLGAAAKELDVDESDSSDDDSEDHAPLATLMNRSPPAAQAPKDSPAVNGHASPSAPGVDMNTHPVVTDFTPAPAAVPTASPAAAPAPSFLPLSTASPTAPAASSPLNTSAPVATSGVIDFDEALGKIPSSGGAAAAPELNFSFDPAFDDNFDFASAGASAFPPPPATNGTTGGAKSLRSPSRTLDFDSVFAPQGNVAPVPPAPVPTVPPTLSQPQESKPFSFDDVFAAPSAFTQPPATQPQARQPSGSTDAHGISFDDAFGGSAPAQALALDSGFGSASSRNSTNQTQSTQSPVSAAFPTTSSSLRGPTSPRNASRLSSSPPPRSVSPPPRTSSPKLRPSTASSEKGKDQPRHSKLSIRLPFGKKKKTLDQPPPSQLSQHLPPVPDNVTPAVDDDVEPVKQLCGMGFTRSQAVAALEANGYEFQAALNSLLAA